MIIDRNYLAGCSWINWLKESLDLLSNRGLYSDWLNVQSHVAWMLGRIEHQEGAYLEECRRLGLLPLNAAATEATPGGAAQKIRAAMHAAFTRRVGLMHLPRDPDVDPTTYNARFYAAAMPAALKLVGTDLAWLPSRLDSAWTSIADFLNESTSN